MDVLPLAIVNCRIEFLFEAIMTSASRPFLKWPGGKYALRAHITALLPPGKRLIEPFVGAGAIFLNTDYKEYRLSDSNPDLINTYQTLQQYGQRFIDDAQQYFSPHYNQAHVYYELRQQFNESNNAYLKALLFLYLNRHGYNGLVRYNQSGIYNVPFGRYQRVYFPEEQLHFFYEKSARALFLCQDFRQTLKQSKRHDVIYCDPPYLPLSSSANFTKYSRKDFTLQDQQDLATLACQLKDKGVHTLISNHHTPWVKQLYDGAILETLQVTRVISCKTQSRKAVKEILALYIAKNKKSKK
jgi:DNA adenine methylase